MVFYNNAVSNMEIQAGLLIGLLAAIWMCCDATIDTRENIQVSNNLCMCYAPSMYLRHGSIALRCWTIARSRNHRPIALQKSTGGFVLTTIDSAALWIAVRCLLDSAALPMGADPHKKL